MKIFEKLEEREGAKLMRTILCVVYLIVFVFASTMTLKPFVQRHESLEATKNAKFQLAQDLLKEDLELPEETQKILEKAARNRGYAAKKIAVRTDGHKTTAYIADFPIPNHGDGIIEAWLDSPMPFRIDPESTEAIALYLWLFVYVPLSFMVVIWTVCAFIPTKKKARTKTN
jgi:hypothetical protein